jgi:hypothetical protein
MSSLLSDFTRQRRSAVIVLVGISLALSLLAGVLTPYAPSAPLLVMFACLALLICVISPPAAVLLLLALQSVAFYRTDEIDAPKIAYFAFHLVVVVGWLAYLAQQREGWRWIWLSVRHARSALPLLLFMVSIVLTLLWLFVDPSAGYLRWVRVFSQFTGYAMLFVVASSVHTRQALSRVTLALWATATATGLFGGYSTSGAPVAVAVNGQMNLLIVVLLGLSLFVVTGSFRLRFLFLASVVIVPMRWLLQSLFSVEQSGLSFVVATAAALAAWSVLFALARLKDARRLIRFLSAALVVCGVGLLVLFAFLGGSLQDTQMAHRGTEFNPFDLSSILSLPTMYLRIQELIVTPLYLERSPIFGLGLTFEIPAGVLVDYYNRPVNYFGGFMHNGYLSTLLRFGVLGMAIFLWFLVSLIRDGWRLARLSADDSKAQSLPFLLGVTLCALVFSMMVYSVAASRFDDRGGTTYLGIVAGLAVAALRLRLQQPTPSGAI